MAAIGDVLMRVRLVQIDGKLPNLALMRLAAHFRASGYEVHLTQRIIPHRNEPRYDRVFASTIFTMSAEKIALFRRWWPQGIVGGTGLAGDDTTIEQVINAPADSVDYSDYPNYRSSIGFTQRGCRLKCAFCVVPWKEGKPKQANTIHEIWRGPGHPKHIHLLDNDFFGQENWRVRIEEIRNGGFKVCLNQGINIRLINDEAAAALATIEYRDDSFTQRRLYTAWDNLKDERIFFRGVERLEKSGVPPKHLMAYMLIGYDPEETMDRIHYRFQKMVDLGIRPYPMVYDPKRRDLKKFQRWAVTGLYRAIPFSDYDANKKRIAA